TIVTSVAGTPIASGGTDIDGEYGVLTIRPDGSYTYVLDTDSGENAGGQETFAYTLEAPNGDTETATLTLTFDSPAASELAMAGLSDPVHDDFESMLQHFGSNADTKFDIGTSGSAAVLQFTEDSPVEYSDAVRIEVNNAYPM
ncbi:MAG TPA: VCBS domain-containing protein, partial [Sphingomicrobium sp.]|nr:VCBS domain-containing protein [Sphingomicrobium sp.]